MKQITAAVEHDLFHAGLDCPLGHQLADFLGGIGVRAGLEPGLEVLIDAGSSMIWA
jgi:hypothetical protein